jgi:uncharacterized membrane protein
MVVENKAPEPIKAPEPNKTSSGMQQNVAGLLCYLAWWITGIIFLIIEKDNKFVRFHAWQSIFTFAAVTIIQIILGFIPIIGWIIGIFVWIGSIILWAICMMKAYRGETFKLPITGKLAENQVKK